MHVSTAAVTLLVAVFTACSGGGTEPDAADFGVLTARIEGANWQAGPTAAAENIVVGRYEITGVDASGSGGYTLMLTLHNVSGPGTYALGVSEWIIGGNGYLSQTPFTWSTTWTGAAGEVTITSLTATRIAGTFHFDADPNLATTPRAVTQGVFDVPVTGGAGVAGPDKGHWIEGDVHGAFIATEAVLAFVTVSNPILSIAASNRNIGVAISLVDVTVPGTYALSATAPVRFIRISGDQTSANLAWSSAITGGSGSVTVTSVTASRIKGTFSATVIGYGGGATGPLSISGTFDMGRGT